MKRTLACLAAVGFAPLALPCMWDRDTLAQEARWNPSVVHIAAGRFERNPPLYYQMRLERLRKEIPARPDDLTLYDDAGVAADRLGQGDEAVAWMERKRARMADLARRGTAPSADARYRTHANLGTFLIHRWLKEGADVKRLAEAKRARAEIARAIEINPDAHFGRERVQLAVMDWILDVKQNPKKHDSLQTYLFDQKALRHASEQQEERATQRVVEGLLGLVALGNAWESFDVFGVLREILGTRGDSSLELIVELRARELARLGKGSLDPAIGDKIDAYTPGDWELEPDREHEVRDRFAELRQEAEAWHARRTAYMEERLKAGRHPDTDPDFWSEFRDTPPPSLEPPAANAIGKTVRSVGPRVAMAGGVVGVALAGFALRRRARARHARRVAERLEGGWRMRDPSFE